MDSQPLVISYCNSDEDNKHPNTQMFISTLINNDWKYEMIGAGEVWTGFEGRMIAYMNVLKTLDKTQIVILSDARDVVCIRNSRKFITEFKKCNKPIVVSMEMFAEGINSYDCNKTYFQVTWIEKYWKMYNIDYTNVIRKFVNLGLIAGYAGDLYTMLKWCIDNGYKDDQKGVGAYVNEFPHVIYADINAELLHTTGAFINGGVQYSEIQQLDSPTLLELCGCKSFFLHVPGINTSAGQLFAYNSICNLLTNYNFNQQQLIKVYPTLPHSNMLL